MRNKNAKVTDPNEYYTDPGSPERILYTSKILPDGSIEVIPCGKENIQDKIEAQREQTDMSWILKQIELGDPSVLNLSPGDYGDFTKLPKTMAEAMQMQIDAEKAWYGMPVEIRSRFDNDLTKWLVTAGSDEWNKKMFPEEYVPSLKDITGEALDAKGDVVE